MHLRRGALVVGVACAVFISAAPGAASDLDRATERAVDKRGPKTKNLKTKDLIPQTPPPKSTAYDRAVARIGDDGSTNLANAKRIFSMVVAELPGVDAPVARSAGGVEGATAVEVILQHFDELSDAERTIVRDALVLPATDDPAPEATAALTTAQMPGLMTGVVHASFAGEVLDDTQLRSLLDEVAPLVVAQLGPAPISTRIASGQQFRSEVNAVTGLESATSCRILALPRLGTLDPQGQRFVVAHELVHCYAYALHGAQVPVPEWIREGGANYVATVAVYGNVPGPLSGLENVWELYLGEPGTSAYDRSYDALGVFAFGAAHGVDAAQVALDSMRAGVDSAAVLTTLLAGATDDWPGGWWRRSDWGPPWDMSGVGITSDRAEPSEGALRNGGGLRVILPAAAAGVGRIEFGSDLLIVEESSRGNVRLDDGTTRTIASLTGTTWCTGSECRCPAGTRQAGRTFPRLAGQSMVMGVTGGTAAARFTVRGRSLEDECERDPLACLVGSWTATSFTTSLFRVTGGGDGLWLRVDRDLDFTLDYSPMTEITATIPDVANIVLHLRIDGVATGRWVIDGDQVVGTDVDASALQSSGSSEVGGVRGFTIGGSVEDLVAQSGGDPTQTDWLALDCTRSRLRLTNPLGGWTFDRGD